MISLLLASLLLAPAYVLKFHLFSLPTNILMVWVFLFWLIFFIYLLIKKQLFQFLSVDKNLSKSILIFTGLFLLSGLISLFVKGITFEKLGQFIVLFLQPISIFFIAGFIFKKNPTAKSYLLNVMYFSLALTGLYAIIQYISLWGLPSAFWGNNIEPKRAISFFVHPNFYALWCAPLLAFLMPDLRLQIEDVRKNSLKISSWIVGVMGLLLSLSRAGWLGLGVAILIYLIVVADKKIRKLAGVIVIILVIVIASVPNLRWRFTLPFYGEKSAVSRLSLWNTGRKAIKESPMLGLGLTGFSNNWGRLNSDPNLDTHNYPHNIFLDLWVETGALGLISFAGLLWIFLKFGFKNKADIFKLGTALFLITLISQGLIDNPYFKNDLAMVFWIILSLAL